MRSVFAALCIALACPPLFADPLPSRAGTESKASMIEFVERVTDPGSPDCVTPADRIATFDKDGTLRAEQPVYFQLIYAPDRLKEKADADPSVLREVLAVRSRFIPLFPLRGRHVMVGMNCP